MALNIRHKTYLINHLWQGKVESQGPSCKERKRFNDFFFPQENSSVLSEYNTTSV